MHIHAYERFWIVLMTVVLAVFLGAVVYAAYGMGIQVPTDAGQVSPDQLASAPPFNEPGVKDLGGGFYQVVMLASAFQFEPGEITVPAGSDVEFVLTSRDVIHGFRVPGTTINAMVMPGQVTRILYRFDEPGEYTFMCHEYCGTGHHVMSGRIVVTAQ
ncbi:MAG: cytochrome c oxidase subunit II [Thermaerobacter sp.]